MLKRKPEDRFHRKYVYDHSSGCMIWTAATRRGYGAFWLGSRHTAAHRFAYETFVGPIPDGLQLDHLCMNKACVNPDHLEAVTARTNTLRERSLRVRCPQGHPYDANNTGRNSQGGRYCKACNRIRTRERYWKMKTAC